MLEGKVAVVTGASRGIGHAIAEALAKQGARVVGTSTSAEGAAKVPGIGKVLNVRDSAQMDAFVDQVQKQVGDIAILVNNAGITKDNLALRMKDADWDEVMETNLRAVFRLSRAVMRGMMKARWGRIINITSVVGESGNAGQANYAAAKAGVVGNRCRAARQRRHVYVVKYRPFREGAAMENIEQAVKKIIAEQLGVNEAEIKNESSFVDDLGADSLDTVELVMALEEEFETEIPDEEAEKITTVQQAVDYIKAHAKS